MMDSTVTCLSWSSHYGVWFETVLSIWREIAVFKILTLGLPAFRYIMGALKSFESVICCLVALMCSLWTQSVLVLWEWERTLTDPLDVWFPPLCMSWVDGQSLFIWAVMGAGKSDICAAFSIQLQKLCLCWILKMLILAWMEIAFELSPLYHYSTVFITL